MGHCLKSSLDHLIGKTIGSFIDRNFLSQLLFHAKMHRLPGHGITKFHHA